DRLVFLEERLPILVPWFTAAPREADRVHRPAQVFQGDPGHPLPGLGWAFPQRDHNPSHGGPFLAARLLDRSGRTRVAPKPFLVLVQRMAGDVEANRLLLVGEPLLLGPFLAGRVLGAQAGARPTAIVAKEGLLPHRPIPLSGGPPLQGLVNALEELATRPLFEVERARFDQRLDHLAVHPPQVNPFTKIEETSKRDSTPGLGDRFD